MPALEALPNLGPKSSAMLAAAGITSLTQLRRLGSVAVFVSVRRAGARPSLNLLWGLEGAVSGLPWQQVAREHRTSLLLALHEYERATPVLYHFAGSRSARAKWLLHEVLGEAFDVENVAPYDGCAFTPEFLARNPNRARGYGVCRDKAFRAYVSRLSKRPAFAAAFADACQFVSRSMRTRRWRQNSPVDVRPP